ncbi:MAG: carbohydrate-binding protein, partial [Fibrobacter sp.]|nr:carbohydrate-binding protein [Fibrobacter sp.]
TKTCDVYGATGKHDLYLKFTGGSGSLFNFDWWRFKEPYVGVEKSVKSGALKGNEIKVYADKKSVTLKSGSFASNNNMKVELYDFSGKMVCTLFQGKTKQHDLSFNLPAIRSGTYLVKILAGSEAFTKTINIQ